MEQINEEIYIWDNIYVDVFSKPIHDIDNLTVSNNQRAFDISDFITMDEKLQKAWIYDYSKLFNAHEESGADITILGVKGKMPQNIIWMRI